MSSQTTDDKMNTQNATAIFKVIQREAELDNPVDLISLIEQNWLPSPKNLTIKQFCHQLPCSRTTVDKYIAKGKIKTIRIGRRVLIPIIEFKRIVSDGL
jgi:excisionase family DNA binding protein